MLDVARLRVLRAVVAAGSVREAAQALGYTPSAVSQQLATLQRETGLHLLDRVGRGVVPTPAALTLAAEAEAVFAVLGHVGGVVENLRAGRLGRLTIGYFASAGAAWLPALAQVLRDEFPEVRLELSITEYAEVDDAALDLDIVVEPRGQGRPGVDVLPLLEDPYVAVVRTDDPLAGSGQVGLRTLADRAWVDNDIRRGPCRQVLLEACAATGFVPEFAVETHDYATALRFVVAGVGLTVLPRLGAAALPPGLVALAVVDPTPVRRIGVAVRRSSAGHPASRRAVEVLLELVRP